MIKKEIAEKLFKAELSQEKVELAIPNLLRMAEEIEANWKEANRSINVEGNKMIDKVVQKVKPLNESISNLKKEADSFVQKAEAIGFDRATIDRELRKIETALKAGYNQSKDLTRRIAEIRNAIF